MDPSRSPEELQSPLADLPRRHKEEEYLVWQKVRGSVRRGHRPDLRPEPQPPLGKGLDLIDRVPDELCNEVRDIVQKTGIKTIPMEKKCKKENGCLGKPYK